jgi:hypothetical protein
MPDAAPVMAATLLRKSFMYGVPGDVRVERKQPERCLSGAADGSQSTSVCTPPAAKSPDVPYFWAPYRSPRVRTGLGVASDLTTINLKNTI